MRIVTDPPQDVEQGSAIVEYALLVVLIAMVCLLALQVLGGSVDDGLSRAGSSIVTS